MHSNPGFIIWSSAIVCVGLAIAALSHTLAQTSEAARGQSLGILLVCTPETIAVPPARHKAFMRQVAFTREFMGADYYFPTTAYEVGLASLVAAIDRYRLSTKGALAERV